MKLFILVSVRAYEKEAVRLFKKAKIHAFSSIDMHGFTTEDHENLIDNWFSSSSDKVNSVLFFTFTDESRIEPLLEEVRLLNEQLESKNPLRALVLSVDRFQ